MGRVYNFSAGPAVLPEEVLQEAAAEMLDYAGTGMSVMEMSHRSAAFADIIESAEADLRELVGIPDNYRVLFLQGGASQQFAAVPMNLMKNRVADYIVTGSWAKKAFKEAKIYGDARAIASSEDETFSYIPDCSDLPVSEDADYVYICENNTIYGTKFHTLPNTKGKDLVADVSSCFLSEPVDITKYGVMYGGAQKNIGPAGVVISIIREDLITDDVLEGTPTMLKWKTQADANSLYNTPPAYGIYICGKVFKWLKDQGGLEAMQQRNQEKAALLYDFLDASKLFRGTVRKEDRSLMNVPFVAGDERDVHERAVLLAHGAAEELARIEEVVEQRGLLLVALLHGLEAALVFQPLEHLAADVDAVGGRRVVERVRVGLRLPLQHGGRALQHVVRDKVLADDGDDHAGRADVLLRATVHDAVLGDVHRLGQEARRHVGHQVLALGVRQRVELRAVDGVVLADVDVVGVFGHRQVGAVGNVGERLVLAGGDGARVAVDLGFLEGLLRPRARDDVVRHAVLHEVHRHGSELLRRAALQEQHAVVVGDAHELAKVGFGRLDDVRERGRAVAHLHDRHAGARVVEHLGCGLLEHLLRQNRGTCRKVVHPAHGRLLVVQDLRARIRQAHVAWRQA